MSQNIDKVKSCDNFIILTIVTGKSLCFTDLAQIFIEIQGWVLLTFLICLHNQNFLDSIIVHMSDKYGTHSVPKPKQNKFLIYKKVVFKIISTLINK